MQSTHRPTLFLLLKCRPETTSQAMWDYLEGEHLASLRSHPGFGDLVTRYVLNFPRPRVAGITQEPRFDAIAHFVLSDDETAPRRLGDLFAATLDAETNQTIAKSECLAVFAPRQADIVGHGARGYKLVSFLNRRSGLSASEFQHHYENGHGPLVRSTEVFAQNLKTYRQYYCDPGAEFNLATGQPELFIDGSSELHFVSESAFMKCFHWEGYADSIGADEERFLTKPTMRFIVREKAVIG